MKGKLFCSIYKSPRQPEMYLYVARAGGLQELPGPLSSQFGKPAHVADMILSEDRPLARADVVQVMAKIREQGFYLQMPPPPEPDMWLANGHPERPRHA
jgi:uncharacterized protein YcgL (UPF0745 family)